MSTRVQGRLPPIPIPQGLVPSSARPFFNGSRGKSFSVRALATEENVTEIELYDEIGYYGVTAKDMYERLSAVKGGTIRIFLNSPGGDVFDGIAIFNNLRDHPATVEVVVVGLAASAASVIAMAADRLIVCENAFLMIHNASTLGYGNRHTLREVADILEKVDINLAQTYAARTGTPADDIAALMDAETWFTAAEAVAGGFADAAKGAEAVTACYDLSGFKSAPAALPTNKHHNKASIPYTARDAETALISGGFNTVQARIMASRLTEDHESPPMAGTLAPDWSGLASLAASLSALSSPRL